MKSLEIPPNPPLPKGGWGGISEKACEFERKIFSKGLLKNSFPAILCHSGESRIQSFQKVLDSRLRGSDGKLEFFRILLRDCAQG
jgi:hypothetical protein